MREPEVVGSLVVDAELVGLLDIVGDGVAVADVDAVADAVADTVIDEDCETDVVGALVAEKELVIDGV